VEFDCDRQNVEVNLTQVAAPPPWEEEVAGRRGDVWGMLFAETDAGVEREAWCPVLAEV